jgi:hypothetical protein
VQPNPRCAPRARACGPWSGLQTARRAPTRGPQCHSLHSRLYYIYCIENEIENENENENGALRVTLAGATQEMDAKADQLRWEPRAPDPANAGSSKDPTGECTPRTRWIVSELRPRMTAPPSSGVRKTPSWPRSWADLSLLWLYYFVLECMGQLAYFGSI